MDKIRVDKLRKSMALLKPVVPKSPATKVLDKVLVKSGRLISTSLENTIIISIPELAGNYLIPYRSVMDLIKAVPGDDTLTIDTTAKTLKLTWGDGSGCYIVPAVEEYVSLETPEITSETTFNGTFLMDAFETALPYAASDTSRPILYGVGITLGNILQIASADGHRASYQTLNMPFPQERSIAIDRDAVQILLHLWKNAPSTVPLANNLVSQLTGSRLLYFGIDSEATMLKISFGKVTFFSKLVQGNFPDILNFLNGFKEPIKVSLIGSNMKLALGRLAAIAKESSGIVRLKWDAENMVVSSQSAEVGEVESKMPILPGAVPGRTAIERQFLVDYFNDKDGVVTMGRSEDITSANIFHYGKTPIVAIMPMQVKWGDEPVEEVKPEDVQAAAAPADQAEAVEEEETGEEAEAGPEEGEEEEVQAPEDAPEAVQEPT